MTGGQGDGETRGPGEEYQGYSVVDEDGELVDAVGLYLEKYGSLPERVVVTGGAVLAGPIGVVG